MVEEIGIDTRPRAFVGLIRLPAPTRAALDAAGVIVSNVSKDLVLGYANFLAKARSLRAIAEIRAFQILKTKSPLLQKIWRHFPQGRMQRNTRPV